MMYNVSTATHCNAKKHLFGLVSLALVLWLLLSARTSPVYAATLCNVKSFGAVGNGSHNDTSALQSAINSCAKQGGGTVELPAGTYLSGPLTLASNITLQVDTNATISGSQNFSDYGSGSKPLALINANPANNITITGGGVINGNGSPWWVSGKAASERPHLIELDHGTSITVSNIHLENAGSMHLYMRYDTQVTVSNVTITAPATSPNTDAIDPADSHHVTISGSTLDVGDDDVAIKAGDTGSSDITIENCTILHGHGISIGSEISGGVQTVKMLSSTFNGTTNGIRIKSNRTVGGDVSGVTYSNLTMTNVEYPIIFTGYYPTIPADGDPAKPVTSTTPYYHSIAVDHLTATGATAGEYIVGVPEKPFTGITLNAVSITAKTGIIVRNATVTTSGTTITTSSGPSFIIQSQGHVN